MTEIGFPNNEANGEWMRGAILRALTRDNRFSPTEVSVDVVPIAKDTLLILITLNTVGFDVPVQDREVLSFTWNYSEGTIERITD